METDLKSYRSEFVLVPCNHPQVIFSTFQSPTMFEVSSIFITFLYLELVSWLSFAPIFLTPFIPSTKLTYRRGNRSKYAVTYKQHSHTNTYEQGTFVL